MQVTCIAAEQPLDSLILIAVAAHFRMSPPTYLYYTSGLCNFKSHISVFQRMCLYTFVPLLHNSNNLLLINSINYK